MTIYYKLSLLWLVIILMYLLLLAVCIFVGATNVHIHIDIALALIAITIEIARIRTLRLHNTIQNIHVNISLLKWRTHYILLGDSVGKHAGLVLSLGLELDLQLLSVIVQLVYYRVWLRLVLALLNLSTCTVADHLCIPVWCLLFYWVVLNVVVVLDSAHICALVVVRMAVVVVVSKMRVVLGVHIPSEGLVLYG